MEQQDLLCPHCDVYLDSSLSWSEVEGNSMYEYMDGSCPLCGAKFKWTEVHSFVKVKEFREV